MRSRLSTPGVSRRAFLGRAGSLGLGIGLAGVLAACGTAPASPTAAPAAPAAATSAPQAAAPAATGAPQATGKPWVVNHWSWMTASDGDGWKVIVDDFNAKNKDNGIQINQTVMDFDQYGTKVLSTVAAGQAPDFGWDDAGTRWSWFKDGVIVPMDDYLKGAGLDLTDFDSASLQAAKYNGKLGGLPMDVMTLALLINTDHAKEAGLDVTKPPSTPDEVVTWADKMTKREGDKVTRSGFLLTGSGLQPGVSWGMIAPMMGSNRIGADGKTVMTDLQAAKSAAQWVLDCFDKNKVSSRDVADRYKAFGTGQGSMFWTGPWTLSGYLKTQGLNFATVPMPNFGKGQATYYELGTMEMFKQSDGSRYAHTAQAMKWLSDNGEIWNTDYRGAAVRKSILDKADYKTRGIPWAHRGVFTDAMTYASIKEVPIEPYLDFEIYTGSGLIPKSLDPVWQKSGSIDDALNKIKAQWQKDVQDAVSAGIQLTGPYP